MKIIWWNHLKPDDVEYQPLESGQKDRTAPFFSYFPSCCHSGTRLQTSLALAAASSGLVHVYVGVFTNAAFPLQFDLLSACKKVSGQ